MATKDILEQSIDDMLRQIVDVAAEGRKPTEAQRYREKVQTLLNEITVARRAMQAIDTSSSNRYTHHKRAIGAILQYLEETGRPATEEEIIDALIRGGFRGGAPGTRLVIEKSFRSYFHGTGRKTTEQHPELGIKKIGVLVGRGDWDRGRFRG